MNVSGIAAAVHPLRVAVDYNEALTTCTVTHVFRSTTHHDRLLCCLYLRIGHCPDHVARLLIIDMVNKKGRGGGAYLSLCRKNPQQCNNDCWVMVRRLDELHKSARQTTMASGLDRRRLVLEHVHNLVLDGTAVDSDDIEQQRYDYNIDACITIILTFVSPRCWMGVPVTRVATAVIVVVVVVVAIVQYGCWWTN